jgi:uncharacterized protein (DUF1015 family)
MELRMGKVLLSAATITAGLVSCQPVKEYQKNRINDSEMTLANRKVEKEELNMESYREGSSGANGGKTGGGCGCN